ncbi:hypothetical protein GUJ93_ZPchr0009g1262 [Zizania palustris]|uniref:Uncharacterized protein n=1 Tax=Zizania palustris TaxID=103762 RepID=A0A8J5RBF3_ZIZPA|nr:hypothetical protein GUJ93_ZPchr0009g1262 [Zizania palustris]
MAAEDKRWGASTCKLSRSNPKLVDSRSYAEVVFDSGMDKLGGKSESGPDQFKSKSGLWIGMRTEWERVIMEAMEVGWGLTFLGETNQQTCA